MQPQLGCPVLRQSALPASTKVRDSFVAHSSLLEVLLAFASPRFLEPQFLLNSKFWLWWPLAFSGLHAMLLIVVAVILLEPC